jgi:hypothetical protein
VSRRLCGVSLGGIAGSSDTRGEFRHPRGVQTPAIPTIPRSRRVQTASQIPLTKTEGQAPRGPLIQWEPKRYACHPQVPHHVKSAAIGVVIPIRIGEVICAGQPTGGNYHSQSRRVGIDHRPGRCPPCVLTPPLAGPLTRSTTRGQAIAGTGDRRVLCCLIRRAFSRRPPMWIWRRRLRCRGRPRSRVRSAAPSWSNRRSDTGPLQGQGHCYSA